MPTYEYRCDACGHGFDEFQSFKDEPLKVCPKCQAEGLRRLFGTGAAILFKGSGFYETDYRSESYKKAAKAEQEAPKPAGANGTTGTGGTGGASGTTSGTSATGGETKSSTTGK